MKKVSNGLGIFTKKYSDASKIMKVHTILDVVIDMHKNKNITIVTIVSDDDIMIQAQLTYSQQ